MKESINIIWCKKDLRTEDNSLLTRGLDNSGVLAVYFFEPSIIKLPDYSDFHLKFTLDSLIDLQLSFFKLGIPLLILPFDAVEGFKYISDYYKINKIIAHEETGNWETYSRDKEVIRYCKNQKIRFTEYYTNGVVRRLKTRDNWQKIWVKRMSQDCIKPYPINNTLTLYDSLKVLSKETKEKYKKQVEHIKGIQIGGESVGQEILFEFLNQRSKNYMYHISKPFESQIGCSRLSPYISYGCLSIRYVFHQGCKRMEELAKIGTPQAKSHKKSINNFLSRLHWQSHFIQKLEDEPEMEFRNLNRDFDAIRQTADDELIDKVFASQSGIPYIDAVIRQLQQTGWTNFRSRAILVSFLCNTCLQPWQSIAPKIAQLFTDYEPGIHYPQFQMQSGTTGINTIRIYNAVLNGQQKDPEGKFIYKYMPELQSVPVEYIHTPDKWEGFYNLDYPTPIVDIKKNNKIAKDLLWTTKGNILPSKKKKIVEKHASRKGYTKKSTKTKKKTIDDSQITLF